MLMQVNGTTVGVVTGSDITLTHENTNVQFYYNSFTGAIAPGGNRATFRLTRWYASDIGANLGLLFDSFANKIPFTVAGQINGVANTTMTVSGCYAGTWKLIMGDANSIVGEEISGEGTGWTTTIP
jgi:hypothetical protein